MWIQPRLMPPSAASSSITGLPQRSEDYREELLLYPSTVAAYTKSGELYREGDTLRQPGLAATLRRIQQKGIAGFYSGETADEIVNEMRRGGGIITHKDLANYRAVIREPLNQTYRGYDIIVDGTSELRGLCPSRCSGRWSATIWHRSVSILRDRSTSWRKREARFC
jgi:hypothetical protein